jgi:hypothetical protein
MARRNNNASKRGSSPDFIAKLQKELAPQQSSAGQNSQFQGGMPWVGRTLDEPIDWADLTTMAFNSRTARPEDVPTLQILPRKIMMGVFNRSMEMRQLGKLGLMDLLGQGIEELESTALTTSKFDIVVRNGDRQQVIGARIYDSIVIDEARMLADFLARRSMDIDPKKNPLNQFMPLVRMTGSRTTISKQEIKKLNEMVRPDSITLGPAELRNSGKH